MAGAGSQLGADASTHGKHVRKPQAGRLLRARHAQEGQKNCGRGQRIDGGMARRGTWKIVGQKLEGPGARKRASCF